MGLTILRLGHHGDGVADGPVFVPRALPGEVVEGEVTHGRIAAPRILTPSPERIAAPCPALQGLRRLRVAACPRGVRDRVERGRDPAGFGRAGVGRAVPRGSYLAARHAAAGGVFGPTTEKKGPWWGSMRGHRIR